MKNIETSVKGNILTITVDLSKSYGHSKSGKTEIIASTGGNRPVPDTPVPGAVMGINIYK